MHWHFRSSFFFAFYTKHNRHGFSVTLKPTLCGFSYFSQSSRRSTNFTKIRTGIHNLIASTKHSIASKWILERAFHQSTVLRSFSWSKYFWPSYSSVPRTMCITSIDVLALLWLDSPDIHASIWRPPTAFASVVALDLDCCALLVAVRHTMYI